MRLQTVAFLLLVPFLTGCAATFEQSRLTGTEAQPGAVLQGVVHGGQSVVSNSQLYLYAVNMTGGYGSGAQSLLGGTGYVTTDASGSWSINQDYTCPTNSYVYFLVKGGNPGLAAGTNNAKLAMLYGVGSCATLAASHGFYIIDEVSTVATAYALAQFTTSETQIGTTSTNTTGIINAFATIPNLVSQNGYAMATTLPANGLVPQAQLNSLADSLAACINSDGTGTPCSTLMTAANVTGANSTPIDTAQAVINIVQNPATNVAAVYALGTASGPFQPTLTAAPNDWTLTLQYGSVINQAQGLAVDATGNIWVSNLYNNNLVEFAPNGALLSPVAGYTSPSLYHPQRVAIDLNGNIWTPGQTQYSADYSTILTNSSLVEFSPNGTLLSGASGFTGGGYTSGFGILVDASNNIWTGGSKRLNKFTNAGVPLSPSTGYTGGGLQGLVSIALDSNGNVWATGDSSAGVNGVTTFTSTLSEFSANGTALSPASGYTGGGLNIPQGIAIDASNNIWLPNLYASNTPYASSNPVLGGVSEFNSSGVPLSPAATAGYPTYATEAPTYTVVDGLGHIFAGPGCSPSNYPCTTSVMTSTGALLSGANGFAIPGGGFAPGIDLSGNLWLSGVTTLQEVVGIAAPVVTPVVKATATGKLGARP